MEWNIKAVSTDFDGTIFAEFENPPIPAEFLDLITRLQADGVKWIINTGRDMPGLMEALARAEVHAKPDYLVLVEREIYSHQKSQYVGWEAWNTACHKDHEKLFKRVRADMPRLVSWVNSQYDATIYEDAYSPFCLIASNTDDAVAIHRYMEDYCSEVPGLTVVRNDVYARFSHSNYDKGAALAEICRHLGVKAGQTLAAGDHLNDLPMLLLKHAGHLVAPANAVEPVKTAVRAQGGFVSSRMHGGGAAEGLKHFLKKVA
jgi:HAD superfamily hydrolase (TIGR01484 family)